MEQLQCTLGKHILIFLLSLCSLSYGWAQVPQKIAYQGQLAYQEDSLITGEYTMSFRLYDAAVGGSLLWSEAQTVVVVDGIFNVLLGRSAPLTLPFDKPYWLGVQVGTVEQSPRLEFASVPYAYNAKMVRGSSVSSNLFPSDGDVGIGTTNPGARLDVAGDIRTSRGGVVTGIEWSPIEKTVLGQLPHNQIGTSVYGIPESIPPDAEEILVRAFIWTGASASQGLVEFRIYTVTGSVNYSFYLEAYHYGQNAVSYNSETFWLPVTEVREIRVTSTGIPVTQNAQSSLSVIGYR